METNSSNRPDVAADSRRMFALLTPSAESKSTIAHRLCNQAHNARRLQFSIHSFAENS